MDIQITNFLNILRTIFDDEKELSLLEPVDWNLLSKMARKQNILPLFFEAASSIEGYVSASVYAKDQMDTFSMAAAHFYEYADGVLMVIRQDWAQQSRILDAVQDFPGQGDKLLGCTMNMVKTGFASYGYGYSSYGYGYRYGKYNQYKGK